MPCKDHKVKLVPKGLKVFEGLGEMPVLLDHRDLLGHRKPQKSRSADLFVWLLLAER